MSQGKHDQYNLPISQAGCILIPSNSFNINSWVIGNKWENSITDLVYQCFIYFFLTDEIIFRKKTTKKLLDRIFNRKVYEVQLVGELDHSFMGKLLRHSFRTESKSNEFVSLRVVTNRMIKSLIDEAGIFSNPWKKIAVRMIQFNNQIIIKKQTDGKLLKSEKYEFEIPTQLIQEYTDVMSHHRGKLNAHTLRNIEFKEFADYLMKLIFIEISKRHNTF